MSGPWEQYQQAPESGPWTQYQSAELAQAQAAPVTDLEPVRAEVSPEDIGNGIARSFGLGARNMLEGGADLVGIVADPIIQGANALGANQATMRQGATRLADLIGLPTAQTATERVSGGITRGLAGGGGIMAMGRGMAAQAPRVVQGIGSLLSSQPKTQIASIVAGESAGGITRESGGGAGAQATASLAGALTPSFMLGGAKEVTRRALRGNEDGRQAMGRTLADFNAVGANPSVGQASPRPWVQGVESLLSASPTSNGVMTRFAERQADNIGSGLRATADNFKPNASAERAGRAVERGVAGFADKVGKERDKLYANADQFIPASTRVSLGNTRQVLDQLTAVRPDAAATGASFVNPKIATLAEQVRRDLMASQTRGPLGSLAPTQAGMDYQTVRDIRTHIGKELSEFSLSTDRPTAQYKALYAALSRDLEETARMQGPKATQAMERANAYFKASADRLETIQRVVDRNGGPEKIYNAVMSGTQDGGSTLRSVMQSLPKDGQRAVTSAVIKRMGLATPGVQDATGEVFSAQTFLKNWNNVSDEAKRALFDRHGPRFSANMDKIARVVSNIRDGSKVFANPSGTANRGAAITYAASLATATGAAVFTGYAMPLGGLIVSGLGANVAARAMTNPKFVAALARATEWPVSALPQFVVILKNQAAQSGDAELAEIARELEQGQQAPRR
jgi:hypothetical protein